MERLEIDDIPSVIRRRDSIYYGEKSLADDMDINNLWSFDLLFVLPAMMRPDYITDAYNSLNNALIF